jgi:hypothetical protein
VSVRCGVEGGYPPGVGVAEEWEGLVVEVEVGGTPEVRCGAPAGGGRCSLQGAAEAEHEECAVESRRVCVAVMACQPCRVEVGEPCIAFCCGRGVAVCKADATAGSTAGVSCADAQELCE